MKRKIIALSLFLAVCIAIATAVVIVNENARPVLSPEDARMRYESIMSEPNTNSNEQLSAEFASLLSEIADGNRWKRAEYAALLRDMTKNTIDFNNGEVFSVAKELSDMYFILAEDRYNAGLMNVTVSKTLMGMRITLEHIGVDIYDICVVENPSEEMIIAGEWYEKYDGSLGKNLIKITLHDINISSAFPYEDRSLFTPTDADGNINSDVKVKLVNPADHSTVVYIGSDKPLNVTEQQHVKTKRPYGQLVFDVRN